jgi:hypothetical protein
MFEGSMRIGAAPSGAVQGAIANPPSVSSTSIQHTFESAGPFVPSPKAGCSRSPRRTPFHQPPDCDTCRVVVARSAVDSMRLGDQERGAWRSMGLGYVALGAAALILYLSVDTD